LLSAVTRPPYIYLELPLHRFYVNASSSSAHLPPPLYIANSSLIRVFLRD
jgi:hypothetical protein